jgi:hypothetical protein
MQKRHIYIYILFYFKTTRKDFKKRCHHQKYKLINSLSKLEYFQREDFIKFENTNVDYSPTRI